MDKYQIRPLAASDSLDELTSMLHRAFGRLGRMGLRCTSVDQPIEVTAHRASRGECFVALAGGRIIGTMTLEPPGHAASCPWYRRPEVVSLHQLAVDPSHQGLDCGKALLAAAEQWARRRGYCELALDTPADAAHLVGFYRSRGFRLVGEFHKPGKPYRSVIMSKTLARVPKHVPMWFSPHRTAWLGAVKA